MVAQPEEAADPHLSLIRRVADAVATGPPRQLAKRVCGVFESALSADGASLCLQPHTEQALLLHATGSAAAAEQAQFALGAGPTVTASAGQRLVLIEDLATAPWPHGNALHDQQPTIRSVLAVPLHVRQLHLGVLTLYAHRARAFTPLQAEYAQCAALLTVVPLTLALDPLLDDWENSTPEAAKPWQTVHQATGRLCERLACSPSDALDLLRARSFADGLPLHDVAARCLSRHHEADDPDTPGKSLHPPA